MQCLPIRRMIFHFILFFLYIQNQKGPDNIFFVFIEYTYIYRLVENEN